MYRKKIHHIVIQSQRSQSSQILNTNQHFEIVNFLGIMHHIHLFSCLFFHLEWDPEKEVIVLKFNFFFTQSVPFKRTMFRDCMEFLQPQKDKFNQLSFFCLTAMENWSRLSTPIFVCPPYGFLKISISLLNTST